MVEVIWTFEADQMREDILRYGYERFGVWAANKLNAAFEDTARLLASFPDIGQKVRFSRKHRRVIQRLVVNKLFSLIYYVDKANSLLYIIAIYDARRDPSFLKQL